MLVYGDHREFAEPGARLSRISETLTAVDAMPPGLARHSKLVGALIDSGQLQQGIEDSGSPVIALSTFVHRLAGCVLRSWDSRYAETGELPSVPDLEASAAVELRLPEGFAFYTVYPEVYAEAARKLSLLGPPRVIGIRSIGTTLGAIVAAALDAPVAITVRPFGDPFARQVELPSDIIDDEAHYVIVDEGPGLSGSSFGSVADWLEARGVPLERIAFLPSHSGDLGREASDAHRERWTRAQRLPAQFDQAFLEREFGPLTEFATGTPWERRKFLVRTDGSRVLLKFAGLGSIGERKLELARALHAAGFTPEPLGLLHGFLVEGWHDEGRPLQAGEQPVEEIGRYIGARARLFPADDLSGATIAELGTMCRRNISLALGEAAAERLQFDIRELSTRVRRVRTDNKLDRVEWLRLPGGRLMKTDALDHHQAHDLIGCQGVEWDLAGAIEEFGLEGHQASRLIEATAIATDAQLLRFYRIAYSGFRLGQAELSGLAASADRYRKSLHYLLHQDSCAFESAGILG